MYVKDECDFQILKRAEEILNEKFNWQIKDDEMTGLVNEDAFSIIEDLCDEIEYLKKQNKIIENDYPNEERDRERAVLGM